MSRQREFKRNTYSFAIFVEKDCYEPEAHKALKRVTRIHNVFGFLACSFNLLVCSFACVFGFVLLL